MHSGSYRSDHAPALPDSTIAGHVQAGGLPVNRTSANRLLVRASIRTTESLRIISLTAYGGDPHVMTSSSNTAKGACDFPSFRKKDAQWCNRSGSKLNQSRGGGFTSHQIVEAFDEPHSFAINAAAISCRGPSFVEANCPDGRLKANFNTFGSDCEQASKRRRSQAGAGSG